MRSVALLKVVTQLALKFLITFQLEQNAQSLRPDKIEHAKASQYSLGAAVMAAYLVIRDSVVTERRSNAATAEALEKSAALVLHEMWLHERTSLPLLDFLRSQLIY